VAAAQAHLDALESQVSAKLTTLTRTIDLQHSQDAPAAIAMLKDGEGNRLMDSIRAEMKKFIFLQEQFPHQSEARCLTNMRYLFNVAASLAVLLSAATFGDMIYGSLG